MAGTLSTIEKWKLGISTLTVTTTNAYSQAQLYNKQNELVIIIEDMRVSATNSSTV